MLEIKNVKGGFMVNEQFFKWDKNDLSDLDKLEQYCDDFVYDYANECREYFEENHHFQNDKIEVGEYFFNEMYDDEWAWEDLESNLSYELKEVNENFGEFHFHTWSSKSGTSVFVKADLNQFEYEIMRTDLELGQNKREQIKYLKEFIENQNLYLKRMDELKDKLIENLNQADNKVRIYAEGVRSGCFSNGEVIFTRVDSEGNYRKGGMLTGKYDEEMGVA